MLEYRISSKKWFIWSRIIIYNYYKKHYENHRPDGIINYSDGDHYYFDGNLKRGASIICANIAALKQMKKDII